MYGFFAVMDWPILIGKNLRNSDTFKREKGVIMNEATRNQLEAKLKKMVDHFDQIKAKQKQPITQSGTGNIIRRRAGEKEQRFSA